MDPISVIKQFARMDGNAAKVVYGGLAIFAAGAIVIGFKVDPMAAGKIGLVVLTMSLILTLVVLIVNDPFKRGVLSWAVVIALIYFMTCVMAAAFPRSPLPRIVGPQPPLPCLLTMFSETVEACERRLVPAPDIVVAPTAFLLGGPERIWLAQAQTDAKSPKIYFQFGSTNTRDQAIGIAEGLVDDGWRVEGAALGGEQVAIAPNDNEVRFFKPEDQQSAIDLATSLSQTTGGQSVAVRDFSRLYPLASSGQLEVWLGSNPKAGQQIP